MSLLVYIDRRTLLNGYVEHTPEAWISLPPPFIFFWGGGGNFLGN